MDFKSVKKLFLSASISGKLMFWLVLVTTLVTIVFASINYLLFSEQLNQSLDDRLQEDVEKLENVLGLHMWNLDEKSIYRIVDEQEFVKSLSFLRIIDNFGQVTYEMDLLEDEKDYKYKTKNVFFEDNKVGIVELAFSKEYIEIAKKGIVQSTLVIIFSVFFAVAFIAFYISRSISRPIKNLTETAKKIASGDLSAKADVGSQDEIGVLGSTFNSMSASLQDSHDQLKQQNELRNKFIKVISHQFRTPLSSIRWNLENVIKEQVSQLDKPYAELLQSSLDSNVELIRRLRDLFTVINIGEGREPLAIEGASLENLWVPFKSKAEKMCQDRQLKCSFVGPTDPSAIISVDCVKIGRVFEELARNASSYTKEGGKVDVKFELLGDKVRFEISDSGIGIPKSEQPKVFEAFFRASNAFEMVTDDSGVSLSIAKYYVTQHGGQIGFTSEEDKGSTFWVELPVKKKGEEESTKELTKPSEAPKETEDKKEVVVESKTPEKTPKESPKTKVVVEDL